MKGFLFACLAVAAFAVPGSIANALDNSFLLQEEPTPPNPTGITSGGGSVSYAPRPVASSTGRGIWKKTRATFYGNPYDAKPSKFRTRNGTPYKSDGLFCATRLVPIGSKIEVKRGSVILSLVVADTQAKRYGHLIDIPSKTWDRFGAKRSVGMLPVEWRRIH